MGNTIGQYFFFASKWYGYYFPDPNERIKHLKLLNREIEIQGILLNIKDTVVIEMEDNIKGILEFHGFKNEFIDKVSKVLEFIKDKQPTFIHSQGIYIYDDIFNIKLIIACKGDNDVVICSPCNSRQREFYLINGNAFMRIFDFKID